MVYNVAQLKQKLKQHKVKGRSKATTRAQMISLLKSNGLFTQSMDKKSEKRAPKVKKCKPGKAPTGKNGRCVKLSAPKVKKCKPGKAPTGKNGRCVKLSAPKVKKSKSKTRTISEDSEYLKIENTFKENAIEIVKFIGMEMSGDEKFTMKMAKEDLINLAIDLRYSPTKPMMKEIGKAARLSGFELAEWTSKMTKKIKKQVGKVKDDSFRRKHVKKSDYYKYFEIDSDDRVKKRT